MTVQGARAGQARALIAETMTYVLRDDLHWCECSGRVVFLDLREDLYSCLPQSAVPAFLRMVKGVIGDGDEGHLMPLIKRGMIVPGEPSGASSPAAAIPRPFADYLEAPSARPPSRYLLAAMASQLAWALRLRSTALARIIANARERADKPRTASDADRLLCRMVGAFEATSLLFPSANRCLVRALSLHSLCRRHGIEALLVFGVRLDPFRAHCWLQRDGRVLIGDYEQVRLFTPIAAVG